MRRKPIPPMSLEELEKLPTKRLLARLRQLHQCEESVLLSDHDDVSNTSGTILFKDTPEWKFAYEQVKGALSLREHIPKGAELAGKRHEQALLSRTIEKRAWRRKPHRNAVIPFCLILLFGARQSFAQDEFLLAKHQAGAVVIGMTIDNLHALHKPSSTRLVASYPEGMFIPLLEVYQEGDTNKSIPSLVIGIDKNIDWIVGSIKVNDARFRTDKGVGVGSTLGAIRKAYAVKWIGFGEGPLCANVEDINMTFELDITNPPNEWYKTRDQRLILDSAKVVSIFLYRSPETTKMR
jgi:hypothetical protein